MDEPMFLIWSNQRGGWWRANCSGYTASIDEAGRYARPDADHIVAGSTLDGQLTRRRTDPFTGRQYAALDEVVVLAPEWIDGAPPARAETTDG